MRISTVRSVLEYEVRTPSHFCLHVQAARCESQSLLSEELSVSPDVALREEVDARTGNRFIHLDASPGSLVVSYKADVELHARAVGNELAEVPVTQLPGDVFPYLLPSRYCESDALCAAAQRIFGNVPCGIERVRAIARWIHENVRYQPGSSNVTTSARDVFVNRAGVCRDFAHLGISFCRALNIPARIVVGYVWFDQPPQDFHAAFEAWVGGRWVMFDPTGMAPPERLVRVGCGFDAVDVAFATYFGDVELARMEVSVLEHEAREAAQTQAVFEMAAA